MSSIRGRVDKSRILNKGYTEKTRKKSKSGGCYSSSRPSVRSAALISVVGAVLILLFRSVLFAVRLRLTVGLSARTRLSRHGPYLTADTCWKRIERLMDRALYRYLAWSVNLAIIFPKQRGDPTATSNSLSVYAMPSNCDA